MPKPYVSRVCLVAKMISFPTHYPAENANLLIVFRIRSKDSPYLHQPNFRQVFRDSLERRWFPFESEIVSMNDAGNIVTCPIKAAGRGRTSNESQCFQLSRVLGLPAMGGRAHAIQPVLQ